MDFDEVADELYSLPVEEFVATRNARVKQAKADGDATLAATIKSLTKPNAVAALTNQLVRQNPAEIQPLIELGEDLRAATAAGSGPRLRELSRLQRSLVSELVEETRQLATEAGRSITADVARAVADTLRAALADPAAAQELLAARLTQGLFRSGLESGGGGSADADDAGADDRPAAAGTRSPSQSRPVRSGRSARSAPASAPETDIGSQDEAFEEGRPDQTAEDERQQAQELLDSATDIRDHAAAAALQADREVADAAAEVERLRVELDDATDRLGQVRRDATEAAADLEKAERLVRAAQRERDRY